MTENYYIKVFRLSKAEAENFRAMLQTESDPEYHSALQTYAHRWIMEIRGMCQTEVECRAIMFRFAMDTMKTEEKSPDDRIILAAYAHRLTDRIQEVVNAIDHGTGKN
jgi:hypothetical protein